MAKTINLWFSGNVNISVDWGDSTSNNYNTDGNISHTYAVDGTYTVKVSGTADQFNVYGTELIEVGDFGSLGLIDLFTTFYDCINLTAVPASFPSSITSLAYAFYGCTALNSANISAWNISSVTAISGIFTNATSFNQSLSSWDTSAVTDMADVFYGATSFNQDISGWDTSNVTNMYRMFGNATSFNQNLSGWCVTNIGSKPLDFDTNTPAWNKTGRQPIWGTCP